MPRNRSHRDGEGTGNGAPPPQKHKTANPPDWKSRLVDTTVRSAVEALLKDANARERKRAERAANKGKMVSDLMTSEIYIYLSVTLNEPPFKPKLRPYAIHLKNSLYRKDEDDICFFVKDPEDIVKDYIEEHGSAGVTQVMGVHRLRKEYGTHEGRRELLNTYDLFLVDNRVSPMMPVLLGNAFLQAKKMPIQVDMRKDVLKGIQKAISSTALSLRQGTSTTVRVGRVDFTAEQIVENLAMAVDGVVRRLPGGWNDIQSLNIKSNKSPALPIYLTLPTASKPYVKPGSTNKIASRKENDVAADGEESKQIEVADGAPGSIERVEDSGKPTVKAMDNAKAAEEEAGAKDRGDKGCSTRKKNKKKRTSFELGASASEPEVKGANKKIKRKKGDAKNHFFKLPKKL